MTVSTSSPQTASLVSIGTWRVLAISSESDSISSSLRCLNTSAARSGPRLTSSTAAFSRPGSLSDGRGSSATAVGVAGASAVDVVCRSSSTGLVLLHPGADLLRDALGVVLGDVLGAHAGHARAGHLGRDGGHALGAPRLEVGQRGGRLDLAQPGRLAERLALAAPQLAPHEEQEEQDAE